MLLEFADTFRDKYFVSPLFSISLPAYSIVIARERMEEPFHRIVNMEIFRTIQSSMRGTFRFYPYSVSTH